MVEAVWLRLVVVLGLEKFGVYSLKEVSRFSKYFRNVVLMCEKEARDSLWLKSTKTLVANKVFCSDSLSRGCNPALKKFSLRLGFKLCNVCKYAALAPTYYLPAPFHHKLTPVTALANRCHCQPASFTPSNTKEHQPQLVKVCLS